MGQQRAPLVNQGLRVFFGGSFDPPHISHEQMLITLINDPLVDFVHVVPNAQSPFKSAENSDLSLTEKTQIMSLWQKTIGQEKNSFKTIFEDLELKEAKKHYTYQSLNILQERYSTQELGGAEKSAHLAARPWAMAIGSDLVENLDKWKEASKLLASLHSVWVFPRKDYPVDLSELNPELLELCHWRLVPCELDGISSTEIRQSSENSRGVKTAHPKIATFLRR